MPRVRTGITVLLACAGAYLLIDWLFLASDKDRVREEVARLAALAEEGGEEAAAEIGAALAGPYMGSPPFDRAGIERVLKTFVERGRVRSLRLGDFTILAAGGEMVIPLLRVDVDTGSRSATLLLRLTFVPEGDAWRLLRIGRWRS